MLGSRSLFCAAFSQIIGILISLLLKDVTHFYEINILNWILIRHTGRPTMDDSWAAVVQVGHGRQNLKHRNNVTQFPVWQYGERRPIPFKGSCGPNIRQKLLEIGKLLLQKNKIKNAGNDIKRAYIFNKTRFRFPKPKIVLPLPAPQYLHFENAFQRPTRIYCTFYVV